MLNYTLKQINFLTIEKIDLSLLNADSITEGDYSELYIIKYKFWQNIIMAAALIKIKGFVQTYTGYNFENITDLEIEELKVFLAEAFLSVRWEIESEFDKVPDFTNKTQYIHNLQLQLTHLAGGLTGFDQENDNSKQLSWVFEWVLNGVFELFEYLRTYFKAYFNYEADLPVKFIERAKNTYFTTPQDLTDKLTELKVDKDLLNLLKNFSEASRDSEKFTLRTWRQWDYLVGTVIFIYAFLDDSIKGDINLELLKLLISQEFNSIQVYAYFIKYVERITLGEAIFQEQQQELLYLIKVFRQVRIDAEFMYDSKVQSLKSSVVESLEAELAYLEQKEKLLIQSLKATEPNGPSKFYFTVAITLAELMFFFRIMLEVKVIFTKFNSYLYEFVSNHIKTQRAENLSKQSQRNHLSNKLFPDRTVKNVKGWLEKMINHINLYYDI